MIFAYGLQQLRSAVCRHAGKRSDVQWTRAELQAWATDVAERLGFTVTFQPIGEEDTAMGAATQMGVFTCDR